MRDAIGIKLEGIAVLSNRFLDVQVELEVMMKQIDAGVADLENGGWKGLGAERFYDEWHNDIRGEMERLRESCEIMQANLRLIADNFMTADDESAKLFA